MSENVPGVVCRRRAEGVPRSVRKRLALFVLFGAVFVGAPTVLTQSEVCTLIGDALMRTAPVVAKPRYLESFVDPVFGSTVTRITGDPGTPIPVGGTWGSVTRHNYAKDAVWNADQSLMVLKTVQGASGHLILDGATYQPQFLRSGPGGETRWHPTLPDVMIYVRSDCRVGHWNVRSNAVTTIFTGAGYTACGLGPWEGNTSRDGRWLALSATRTSDGRHVAFAVDLAGPTKYPDLDLGAKGVIDLDWVSISASGTYLVVNGTISGCATVAGACDATKVFTRSGVAVGPFWSEYGHPSHYDLTLDVAGADVAVGVAKSAPNEGKVLMRRLADGVVTVLNVGGYSQHHSARNLQRPGWAYVSHPYNGPYWPPFRNEVFAVKLDGSLQIERIAHLHATTPTYESQPQVVPSPDGTRVIFASNWDNSTGPVQAYVADVRSLCAACSFSLGSTSQSVGATGGTSSVSLSTSDDCSWVARSEVSWITVANTSSQSGQGTVTYTVAANTTSSARTGTLSIAGLTFTVTQAAASQEPASVIATMVYPANGATNVDPTKNFRWTSVTNGYYKLQIGASYGSSELLSSSTTRQTWLSVRKLRLPSGRTLYARLWTLTNGIWRWSDSTFTVR